MPWRRARRARSPPRASCAGSSATCRGCTSTSPERRGASRAPMPQRAAPASACGCSPTSRRMSADDSLTAFAHRAAHMELRLVAARVAVEVVAALSTAGVDALVVKGATIAQRLYEPGEARGYLDCDLLIAPAGLAAAGAVLPRLGFRCLRDQTLHPEAWAEPHEQLWRRRRRELVELHWPLPGVGAAPDRTWELLWGARGAVAIAGAEVAALGPAAAALHVAMHAAQHGGHLGKSLVDLR